MKRRLPALLLCTLAGCANKQVPGAPVPASGSLSQRVSALESQVVDLRRELERVERRAFCPPAVKKLLEDVRDNTSCTEGNICISPLLESYVAEGVTKGRFLDLLGSVPYGVFYPAATSKGYVFLRAEDSRARLRSLTSPPWLPNTKFLLVSNMGQSASKDVAVRRVKFLLAEMGKLSFDEFPGYKIDVGDLDHPQMICKEDGKAASVSSQTLSSENQILRWAFSFKLMPGEVLGVLDRPPRGKTLDESIFVFRVDCPLSPKKPEKRK